MAVTALVTAMAAGCSSGNGGAGSTPSSTAGRPSAQPSPAPSPTQAAWAEDACLDVSMPKPDVQPVAVIDCSQVTAGVRITRLVERGQGAGKCPRDADGWLDTPAGQDPRTACLRNSRAPHPGDPGKGGGILRVGDCTLIGDDNVVQERECYDAHGPGKIRSFTKTKKGCENRAWSYAYKREGSYTCVGPGAPATKIGPQHELGSCLTAPKTKKRKGIFGGTVTAIVGGLKDVPCASKKAWGKVVGAISAEFECKRPADYSVTTSSGIGGLPLGPDPYPDVTCVRRL